jgi:hypothetical protein
MSDIATVKEMSALDGGAHGGQLKPLMSTDADA